MKNFKLFVGVDISKVTVDAHVLSTDKQRSEHQVFQNTKTGFKKLLKWIDNPNVFVCMEHSGIYASPLCFYLNEKQVDYTLVPGIVIRKSLGLQRGKSDKADALAIARFALRFHDELEPHRLPEHEILKLKLLVNNRDRLVKAKNLLKVPTKENASFLDKSIVPKNSSTVRVIEKAILKADRDITELIKAEEQLSRVYDLLVSVPGVGPQIAANILIVTRGFTCFKDARKFACYCGIAPFEYSSGTSIKGRSKVSPFANKHMKSLLNMGALNAKRHDQEMRLYYERKVAEGKNGMLIINAIRNKLVQRIFAVVNRGTPFIPLAKYAA